MKKPTGRISNRRARFDYELGDTLVVGLALTGAETKALRQGHGDLTGAYVSMKNNELWLVGAKIFGSNTAPIDEDGQARSRKLLAKAGEIKRLSEQKGQGKTLVPLELLTDGRYIKLRIADARGKKSYDKRETIKKRQQEREANRVTKR